MQCGKCVKSIKEICDDSGNDGMHPDTGGAGNLE